MENVVDHLPTLQPRGHDGRSIAQAIPGQDIERAGLELPLLIAENPSLAGRMEELHETIGNAGYYLIGLHALGALFHHYVRHDNTLQRMRIQSGRR